LRHLPEWMFRLLWRYHFLYCWSPPFCINLQDVVVSDVQARALLVDWAFDLLLTSSIGAVLGFFCTLKDNFQWINNILIIYWFGLYV
jgi:hypothetical protein